MEHEIILTDVCLKITFCFILRDLKHEAQRLATVGMLIKISDIHRVAFQQLLEGEDHLLIKRRHAAIHLSMSKMLHTATKLYIKKNLLGICLGQEI